MNKIVHSYQKLLIFKNSNFGGYTAMPLECDNFVFRKVN